MESTEKNYKKIYPTELSYCSTIEEALADADICFIFTEWEEIKKLPVSVYERYMKKAIIIDGRNCYALSQFDGVRAIYDSIGRCTVDHIRGNGIV